VNVERMENGDGRIATVKMNRGPVNSLNSELITELTYTIKELEREEVRGVILASDAKVFSAGLDLNELNGVSERHFRKFWDDFETLFSTLYLTPIATVACIESHAPAGGSVLALSCDYRVMAKNDKLKMGLNETQLGMVPPRWLQAMCAQTVGARNSELLLQQGLMMSPSQALGYGFIDETVDPSEVAERSRQVLDTLTKLPPRARALTKLQQREHITKLTGPDSATELYECLISSECKETVSALLASLGSKKK